MRRWIVVLLFVALPPVAVAQRAAETMRVTVVEVPVTVVDRDGSPVSGLTAANFELYDEGKRVPIAYFEVLEPAKVVVETAHAAPLPPAATRYFLLLFDLANSSPGAIERAAEAAKAFVRTQLGPRDLAAVSTFTAEAGARMVTNFTRDRDLLVDAIETLGNPNYFKIADPVMISARRTPVPLKDAREEVPEEMKKDGPGMLEELEPMFESYTKEVDRSQKTTRDTETRNRLRIQFSHMSRVARALDRLSGQKQIILLSEGFDARVIQGRENLGLEATRKETDLVMSGEVWEVDSQERFGSTSSSRDLGEMVEIFRRSDVVLHAFDIKGLRGTTDVTSGDTPALQSTESLHLITKPTGGTVFKNANDMRENFTKMLRQQEIVYLLGFSATSSGNPGGFHTLRVKPVGVRNVRLSHRAGYYEPASRITALEQALTLGEILMTDASVGDIRVALGATAIPGPEGETRVPVVMEIPGTPLLEDVSGDSANAQILIYAFDQNSRVVDFLQQKISLDLTKAGDRVRSSGLRFYGSLYLPPGAHVLKAIVRVEETGRIGFKRSDIRVPGFDAPSVMPPLLFSEVGEWAMLFARPRGDDDVYPFAAGDAKYAPNSEPDLAANGDYKVVLFLHRVPTENLSVTSTLIMGDGISRPANVTLTGRMAAGESGSMKLLFDFKTESVAAGSHELRFDVKTKDGTQTVVSMPFTVW